MRCPATLYRQFAGHTRADRRGWVTTPIELAPRRTALVVMHAWDPRAPGVLPGMDDAVEYLPRARRILAEVFPPLLAASRAARFPILHVPHPGPPSPTLPGADAHHAALLATRAQLAYPGEHPAADIARAFADLRLAPAAQPHPGEPVAQDADDLARHCAALGITHLIYIGFALNWCLLMSPGGMIDMKRRGYLCSTIPEATTAVERSDSADTEAEKASALWRVAVEFGYILNRGDFTQALQNGNPVT